MGEETRLSASCDNHMREKYGRLDRKFTIGGVAGWSCENLYSIVASMKNIRDICWSISETAKEKSFNVAYRCFQRDIIKRKTMVSCESNGETIFSNSAKPEADQKEKGLAIERRDFMTVSAALFPLISAPATLPWYSPSVCSPANTNVRPPSRSADASAAKS